MYHYKYEDGRYNLFDEDLNKIVASYEQVAFCYDAKHSVLIKHGEPEKVEKYFSNMVKLYSKFGLQDVAADQELLILPNGFPVEEINKCLDICDYIGILAKRIKYDQTI